MQMQQQPVASTGYAQPCGVHVQNPLHFDHGYPQPDATFEPTVPADNVFGNDFGMGMQDLLHGLLDNFNGGN